MKKYNISKELKQLLVEALKDLNRKIFSDYHRLANEYDIRPQKNPDTGKMEIPNFSLDMTPDEMQQLRQQTIDQGLEPVFTDLGAKDDLDPQDTVKSYEPTVNMRKDKDATKTLKNHDLEDTDIDGDTEVDTEYDKTSVVAEEIAAALIRKITKGRTDMSLEELKAALKEELEQEA